MKHPETAGWMEYLYGEAEPLVRAGLEAHLAVCPECRDRVERWRMTHGLLEVARVEESRGATSRAPGWGRGRGWGWRGSGWIAAAAAAAAVLLLLGVRLGRLGAVTEEEMEVRLVTLRDRMRAEYVAQREVDLRRLLDTTVRVMREEQRAVLGELVHRQDMARAADRHETALALEILEQRYGAESARLRDGLRELAATTGTGFLGAQEHLRLLSSFLPSVPSGDDLPLDPNHFEQPTRNQYP